MYNNETSSHSFTDFTATICMKKRSEKNIKLQNYVKYSRQQWKKIVNFMLKKILLNFSNKITR